MSLSKASGRLKVHKSIQYSAIEYPGCCDEDEGQQNNTPAQFPGWPRGPSPLRGISFMKFLGDVCLVLLPIPFLALTIVVLRLNATPLSDHGRNVQSIMKLGPTLFPLVFAASCGRSLRTTAIWLAEQGTTIDTLEKLLRSQSFVSALGTSINLRSLSTISIPLLLLWSLSPLGGQSSLRLVHETNHTISNQSTVYYSSADAPFYLDQSQYWYSVVPTTLLASLSVSPTIRRGPRDLWNHPKIPRLPQLEKRNCRNMTSPSEWFLTDLNNQTSYTSLLGVNVQGLYPGIQSNFRMNYSYMAAECRLRDVGSAYNVLRRLSQRPRCIQPPLPVSNGTSANEEDAKLALANTTIFFQGRNMTKINEFVFKYGFNHTTANQTSTRCNTDLEQNIGSQVYFIYGQYSYVKNHSHIYECLPRFYNVEVQVDCDSDQCHASRMRSLPNDQIRDPINNCVRRDGFQHRWKLPCLATSPTLLNDFVRFFIMATTSYPSPLETTIEYSIFDDFILGGNETYPLDPKGRDLDLVSEQIMSERITLVLNAFWQAASWGPLTTRMEHMSKPKAHDDLKLVQGNMKPILEIANTTATIQRTYAVYEANIAWCVTLLAATSVLLLLGLVNLIMSWCTIAPDMFSYAASLTKGNPHTHTPEGGSGLGGTERSRLLRGLLVQIADVRPEGEVGVVGFRSVEQRREFEGGRLRKGRMYE